MLMVNGSDSDSYKLVRTIKLTLGKKQGYIQKATTHSRNSTNSLKNNVDHFFCCALLGLYL